jgi:hypothetical protein
MNDLTPIEALRELWDTGTALVSPGTLGMTMTNRRRILTEAETVAIANALRLPWDGTWIRLERRP